LSSQQSYSKKSATAIVSTGRTDCLLSEVNWIEPMWSCERAQFRWCSRMESLYWKVLHSNIWHDYYD